MNDNTYIEEAEVHADTSHSRWAKTAVEMIRRDISNRSGLHLFWDGVDEDVQQEIAGTWAGIIERAADSVKHR